MAFKRMNKLNSSIILKEKINQIRDILFIQFKLLNNDSNVIFLDEFKLASESTKYFGWSKRNQNGHLFMNLDKFNASFMIVFSIKEIIGVTATESTYSSKHFKNFLLKLINYNDCDTYIFMDNAPIHAAKKIVELCAKANL